MLGTNSPTPNILHQMSFTESPATQCYQGIQDFNAEAVVCSFNTRECFCIYSCTRCSGPQILHRNIGNFSAIFPQFAKYENPPQTFSATSTGRYQCTLRYGLSIDAVLDDRTIHYAHLYGLRVCCFVCFAIRCSLRGCCCCCGTADGI